MKIRHVKKDFHGVTATGSKSSMGEHRTPQGTVKTIDDVDQRVIDQRLIRSVRTTITNRVRKIRLLLQFKPDTSRRRWIIFFHHQLSDGFKYHANMLLMLGEGLAGLGHALAKLGAVLVQFRFDHRQSFR